ncbi:MAG: hypothetical protein ABI083_05570 [Lapillicoccus sp.]
MPALITWWTQDIAALAPDAASPVVAAVGADLLRRWADPRRRYHSTRHLVEMFWALEELEEATELGADEAAIGRLTAWLHDAVYDPEAPPGRNESESAALAGHLLPTLGLAPDTVARVVGLIEMTDGHELTDVGDTLGAAFHDADLWILSAPRERFDAYGALVREEYASVPDIAFRAGRRAILEDFLRRDRLYATDHAHAHWDAPARINLQREVDRLA